MEGRSNKLQIIINNLEQRNKKGKKKPGREVKKGKGRENVKKIEGQHSEELKEKGRKGKLRTEQGKDGAIRIRETGRIVGEKRNWLKVRKQRD